MRPGDTSQSTYHNSPETKALHVMLVIGHAEADLLRAGSYAHTDGTACSVGCLTADYGLPNDDHAALAARIGWPEWLVWLQDRIFEGLPAADRPAWHVSLAEAVPVGADLALAKHRILARILREVALPHAGESSAVVVRVAELHERVAAGGVVTDEEWRQAEEAAWAAAAAAAARAAWTAARAAGWRQIRDIVLEEVGRG